ncbi:hypothetical protein STEG23_022406 [Scotinomys teguina]
MEEFDSEDFSTSDEDEDYVPSGGEYSEDDVSELVKEDEVDGEDQAEKTKGKRRKAQSLPASWAVGAHTFNPSTCEFKASLVYRVNYRTFSATQAAEETEETSSNKLLVKTDELEKQPKESEKVKITKVFDFAGEEVSTGFLCVALDVLELTLETRPTSNSQRSTLG